MSKYRAYCVKCKNRSEIRDAQRTMIARDRPSIKGKCGVCGAPLYKILCVLRVAEGVK